MSDNNPISASGQDSEEDFSSMFAASEAKSARRKKISPGDVVKGKVIALGSGNAFVEIGAKGDAVIDLAEFRDPQTGEVTLAIGDEIEATVTDDGTRSGSITLKRTLGRGGHVPGELEQALAHRIAVEGLVTAENKGGYDVQLGSTRAFCPGSQMDRMRGEPSQYVGQRLRFYVTKIDAGGRNIVVARRPLLEEEEAAKAAVTREKIKVGAILQGTVSSVRDFGAFVDLGGLDGLIHISEIGHARTTHPSDVLQPGQTVEVKVISVEQPEAGGRGKIGLSLRALAADPWTTARERFPVGSVIAGVVRRLEPFGAFVEIAPGLDGLVHISQMVLDRRISHPKQVVQIGDPVQVTVVNIDPETRRVGLSMTEAARRELDANKATERKEEEVAVAQINQSRTLGSFADLLANSKKGR